MVKSFRNILTVGHAGKWIRAEAWNLDTFAYGFDDLIIIFFNEGIQSHKIYSSLEEITDIFGNFGAANLKNGICRDIIDFALADCSPVCVSGKKNLGAS